MVRRQPGLSSARQEHARAVAQQLWREAEGSDRVAAVQGARVATLEQANRDLSWQVAMLTKGAPARPASPPHGGPRETVINLPLLGPGMSRNTCTVLILLLACTCSPCTAGRKAVLTAL